MPQRAFAIQWETISTGNFERTMVNTGHLSNVCDMMSIMSAYTFEDGQKVLDPACGSGRMLLSAAKCNRFALFYVANLDATRFP